jgi:rhodanese-related sulfurtransferase
MESMDATTIEAKELSAEQGKVKLIDVRTPAEFGEMHIEGSELMPLDRLEPERVKGEACVVICRSGKRAAQAMEKLKAAGCEQLRVLEGGVLAWEAAGLPLKRGKAVLSLERQVRIAAGLLVLCGVILGASVHSGFYGIAAFVGAGLTFAGLTDWCGMAMLLAKAPWNQRAGECGSGNSCSV